MTRSSYFGTGVVVSIPKEKWEVITPEDSGTRARDPRGRHRHRQHPLAPAERRQPPQLRGVAGPQPNGPLIAGVLEDYKAHTGREAADDFPYWEPCHRALLGNRIVGFENVGGRFDLVTGKR